jgi:hypothetical protein
MVENGVAAVLQRCCNTTREDEAPKHLPVVTAVEEW